MSRLSVSGRTMLVALLGMTLVPLALALSASPASAHNELTASTPKDGASLTSAPKEVTLTFAEPVDQRFLKIAVTGPDGATVAAGGPAADGRTVRQPLGPLRSGPHVVAYRVVSLDGHPVQGTVRFTATLPAAAPPSEPAAADPAPQSGDAARPGDATPQENPSTRTVANARSYGAGWLPYAVLGAVVLGVAGIGFALTGRRRGRNTGRG